MNAIHFMAEHIRPYLLSQEKYKLVLLLMIVLPRPCSRKASAVRERVCPGKMDRVADSAPAGMSGTGDAECETAVDESPAPDECHRVPGESTCSD